MTAALRAWGAARLALLVVGVAVLIETTATDQFNVPPFTHHLNGWCFVPPVVAIVMAEPLVDRAPELTSLATRHPATTALARLGLSGAGGLAVAAYCLPSAQGGCVATYVVVFLALATLMVALLGPWHWVPLLVAFFAWLQLAGMDFPGPSFALPACGVVAAAAVSCTAYVASAVLRLHLRQRSGR